MRTITAAAAACCLLAAAGGAQANVKWTVSGATFAGGDVTLSGYFVQDALGSPVDYDLKFAGVDTFEFTPITATQTSVGSTVMDIGNGAGEEVYLVFDNDLLAVNSPLGLGSAFVYYNGGSFGFRDGPGTATAQVIGAPEPAGWALMLSGVFGLGALLRRRRERALAA